MHALLAVLRSIVAQFGTDHVLGHVNNVGPNSSECQMSMVQLLFVMHLVPRAVACTPILGPARQMHCYLLKVKSSRAEWRAGEEQ
jgi:hypothetical protein